MHLIYVDESGDDGFNKNNVYSPFHTPTQHFIRTGLIIHDKKWQKVNKEISQFRAKNKIPKEIELHATEILNGRKKYHNKAGKRVSDFNWFGSTYPNKEDRIDLIKNICQLISNLDITIISIIINKLKINQAHANFKIMPKNNSWEFLIERVNLFLSNSQDDKGMLISDAIQFSLEQKHREFAKALYAQSLHIHEFHFIESILFEPSDSSELLQLVDIISFAFHRKYNMNDFLFYDKLKNKIFSHNETTTGVGEKIWP